MNLYFAPDQDCQAPLIDMIDGSQNLLTVADYSFSAPLVTDAIIKAHQRGVNVVVLLDKSQSSGKVEVPEIAKLQAAGVPFVIGESDKHRIMHLKVAVADDTIAFGSYNFTNAAALENNVLAIYTNAGDAQQFVFRIQQAINFIRSSSKIKLERKDMNLASLVEWFQGKKTYIIAFLAILDGLYQYVVQHGLSRQSLVNYLLLGGGLAALRAAVSKVQP